MPVLRHQLFVLRTTLVAAIALTLTAVSLQGSAAPADPVAALPTLPSPVLVNEAGIRAGSGVTDTEVLLGQSAALSGPSSEIGKQFKAGAEAYFNSVNDLGGVYGRKIRLQSLDDANDPAKAAANTRTLLDTQKVFGLFGYVGAANVNAALPIATAQRAPFFAPVSGEDSLRTQFNPYVFNVTAGVDGEARAISNYLVTVLGNKRIAVLYQNDAEGESGVAAVERALAVSNVRVVAKAPVERDSMNMSAAVTAIDATKPQSVLLITSYKQAAAFIKVMEQIGITGHRAAYWSFARGGTHQLANELGPRAQGIGVAQVVPLPTLVAMQAAIDYRKAVAEKDVNFISFEGYLAAKTFVEGLKRAGKNPTRESFVKGLETAGRLDLGGYSVQFSPTDHNGSRYTDLTMVGPDGRFVH